MSTTTIEQLQGEVAYWQEKSAKHQARFFGPEGWWPTAACDVRDEYAVELDAAESELAAAIAKTEAPR
jgi:hypothetical protein